MGRGEWGVGSRGAQGHRGTGAGEE